MKSDRAAKTTPYDIFVLDEHNNVLFQADRLEVPLIAAIGSKFEIEGRIYKVVDLKPTLESLTIYVNSNIEE